MESFDELDLSPEVMQAIRELGYVTPSPIQARAMPILLEFETDFIGQAATGTGKTAAFGIPLVESVDPTARSVQALVLCPTRELAVQVSEQIALFGKHKKISSVAVYGGAGYDKQIQGLKRSGVIVVGTPGRVLDHLERGTLQLKGVKTIVLDEADEMISMGFKEDLEAILSKIPEEAHTWLFSATMGPDVRQVADKFLENPERVSFNRKDMLPASVEQIYYTTHESNKPEVLCKIIDAASDFYGLIFCQTKALVADLHKYMQTRGYHVDCLHGDMNQTDRSRTLTAFRERQIKVLVCTDVASRGIDVKNISHVVNYSIPRELDVYVHRIGRTARVGQSGIAISLVTPSHRNLVRQIEQMTKTRLTEGKIPGRKEIAQKKVGHMLSAFKSQKWHTRATETLSQEWRDLLATMDSGEIAGRFVSMILGELFTEREEAPRHEPQEQRHQQRHRERPHQGDRHGRRRGR